MAAKPIANPKSIHNHPGRSRLERQYFVVFGLLLGGGLITSGLLDVYFRYRESREQIEALQRQVASEAATRIAQFVLTIESQLRAAAVSSTLAERGITADYEFELEKLIALAPAIDEITAIDAAGQRRLFVSRYRVAPDGASDFSRAPGFLQAKQGANFFGPVYFLHETEPYIDIVVPIERFAGQVIGALQAPVSLKHIGEVVRDLTVGETGRAYIVTRPGDIVAHSDPGQVLQRRSVAHLAQVRTAFQPNPVAPKPQTLRSYDLDGQEVLSSLAFLPSLDWAVIVEQPLSEAHRALYSSILRTSALLLVGLGIALMASIHIGRRVVRPLETLRRGVERIRAGDLTQSIEIKTGNEIDVLADEFNKMIAEIKNSYQLLEDRVRQRTRELTALLDVTASATRSLEIDLVLQAVSEKISEILGFDATRIFLFDRAQRQLHRMAECGINTGERVPEVFASGQGVVGRVAESGTAIVFSDVRTDPDYETISSSKASKINRHNFLAVFPIKSKDRTLGVITCLGKDARVLAPEEIRLITTMADQIGPAVDNWHLFEQVKEKTAALENANRELVDSLAQQTAVAGTLRVMAGMLSDLQTVFDTILSHSVRLTRARGGVIRLLDDAGVLRFVAHSRGDHKLLELQLWPLPSEEQSASTQAIRQKRAIQIRDIQNPGPDWQGPVPPGPWRTALAIPLISEEQPIGVIVVFRDTVESFTDQQVELVATFADQAVVAIKNADLFQKLQQRTSQLELANARLTRLDYLKSGFLSNVSHELKSPLTAIGSLADNMLDGFTGVLNAKQIHYVSGIKVSTERLTRLINDLLDLSVIESGKIELVKNPFSLSALIGEVAENLTPLAREKSITLNVPLAKNREQIAWADRDKITQVLTNLITNAVKFTPPGGAIDLAWQALGEGEWLQVRVSDNGPGIPRNEARLIFDEFYQISQPGDKKAAGVGLGLAICKKLIDMHGGQIWVESEVGRGSSFYFTVPASRQAVGAGTVIEVHP